MREEVSQCASRYAETIHAALTSKSLGQTERSRDSNRPQFEFITVSGTNIRGDTETRRRVRSRAQADYRRRNPPPPRNALTVDLDVGSWLQALSRDATLRPQHGEPVPLDLQSASSQANEMMQLNPAGNNLIGGREGAGIFLLVPSDQRPRARELWNHCSYNAFPPSACLVCSPLWFSVRRRLRHLQIHD